MEMRRRLGGVVVAALFFAAWEIVDHVFLMGVDMITYHLIGFFAETLLAAAAIVWATNCAEQARQERERAERLARVVATAIASSETDVSPVARLMDALAAIRERTRDMPDVQKRLEAVEEDARRIQVVTSGLKEIVLPLVQP